MRYLLDTCVISEIVKRRPRQRVVEWVGQQEEMSLYLSVLTLGELHKGISKLPAGDRRTRLARWVQNDLVLRFEGRTVAVSSEVAERWGVLSGEAEAGGRPLPVIDGLLAASAIVSGMVLVTRNAAHFADTGVTVLDPWTA